jgi:hypothetical protein
MALQIQGMLGVQASIVVFKCNWHIEKSYLTHLIAFNMIVLKVGNQKYFKKL